MDNLEKYNLIFDLISNYPIYLKAEMDIGMDFLMASTKFFQL